MLCNCWVLSVNISVKSQSTVESRLKITSIVGLSDGSDLQWLCGVAPQSVAHLLSCVACPVTCTYEDLMAASTNGVTVAEYYAKHNIVTLHWLRQVKMCCLTVLTVSHIFIVISKRIQTLFVSKKLMDISILYKYWLLEILKKRKFFFASSVGNSLSVMPWLLSHFTKSLVGYIMQTLATLGQFRWTSLYLYRANDFT